MLICFHKYFRTHCLVLWQVSFRNNVWFISSLNFWPSGLTPSQSFVYLLIPSEVDCRVLFWSTAVDLVFPIMGNVSVSCLLLLTFHLLIDLNSKLMSPVCIFSSSSCKTSKEKQLQLNNQEPSYSSWLYWVVKRELTVWIWSRVSKWMSWSRGRIEIKVNSCCFGVLITCWWEVFAWKLECRNVGWRVFHARGKSIFTGCDVHLCFCHV